jgi:pimeloyl-ACP methyl ester carboxylesterase
VKKSLTPSLFLVALLAAMLLTACVRRASPSNVASTPAGSATSTPAPQTSVASALNNPSCIDTSGHKVSFITVEPGVELEVLDWGGAGETLVLLTGLGDNAHVYDHFAYQFTDLFHVIGFTRRGFGQSSQPAQGYDVETRARDYIKVLDALNIPAAMFAGHSLAGEELSTLGVQYPDRVKKLVYMDAYDYGSHKALPAHPAPEFEEADAESVERFAAVYARHNGYREPNAALCNSLRMDSAGRIIDSVTPPEIQQKIFANSKNAQFERIEAPALGIFYVWTPTTRLPAYYFLDAAQQAEYEAVWPSYVEWQADAIQRFSTGISNSRVIELADSNHYVYLTDEGLVAREMREFLLGE